MKCTLCPRNCGVDRDQALGVCQVSSTVKVARAALHFWEEPCISGEKGSGAVFFSGCPLHCVFCQNEEISHGKVGQEITVERLSLIYLELQSQGANNINLVTGTHYIPAIVESVKQARKQGLLIPIVYNTSGYETVESLRMLEGIVDVYLPDFKYWDGALAREFSHAEDYPEVAKMAISEMVRQCPTPKFDANGFIQSGVIVRQLLLPGHVNDSKAIIQYLYDTFSDNIYISIMNQYTPIRKLDYEELNHPVKKDDYYKLIDYADSLGISNAFCQEDETVSESFIPKWNFEGIKKDV